MVDKVRINALANDLKKDYATQSLLGTQKTDARVEEFAGLISDYAAQTVSVLAKGNPNIDVGTVAQESVLQALRKFGVFHGVATDKNAEMFGKTSEFTSWFHRICYNIFISHYRREVKGTAFNQASMSSEFLADAVFKDIVDKSENPVDSFIKQESEEKLRDIMRTKLTPEHAEILVLRHFEDKSYEEMAATLDINIGTVRSRLHRATEALGKVLRVEDASRRFAVR